MVTTLMTRTPNTGLSADVASTHSAHTAPVWTEQGTGLSIARLRGGAPVTSCSLFAQVAFGARVADLPGLPPRGAPV